MGNTVAMAFGRMYNFERACSMQVRLLAGRGIHQPSKEVIAKVAEQGVSPAMDFVMNQLAWPALLRMLDRRDPSYKE